MLTLAQLAEKLGVELRGDGSVRISTVAPLENAQPGALSFLANPAYKKYLATTSATAVVVAEADICQASVPVLVSDNPYYCYAQAVRYVLPQPALQSGIHPTAVVDASSRIDKSAWIGPQVVIESGAVVGARVQVGPGCIIGSNVHIGADSTLAARVTVIAQAWIGKRAFLHPGVVIGADGFGFAQANDQWHKVQQVGSVRLGNDVDVGANSTIDRGAIEDTILEDGVKIDNQVQVAHNVQIGAHTAIAACVGISGSTCIGSYCTLAGGVGVIGHLQITDHVHVTAMSLVTHSIRKAGRYSAGSPLMENVKWRRNTVRMKQLDDMSKRLKNLETRIKDDKGSV